MPTITHDHLSVEESDDGTFRVVAWSIDGVPCTVDDSLDHEAATSLRDTLAVIFGTW